MNRTRNLNKLRPTGIVLLGLLAVHCGLIVAKSTAGVDVPEPYRMLCVYGVMVPMIIAWLTVVVEELTKTY
jgi:hypothetical protein